LFFAEAALAVGVVFFAGPVAVLFGTEQAGAGAVVDGLGFVLFQYLDGRRDLVAVGSEDDALNGT
jgi:hypothetical protein